MKLSHQALSTPIGAKHETYVVGGLFASLVQPITFRLVSSVNFAPTATLENRCNRVPHTLGRSTAREAVRNDFFILDRSSNVYDTIARVTGVLVGWH